MKNTTLLEIAHSFIARHAPQNGVYLDATAGNGHDTLFLCSLANGGLVIAADIQDAALESTQQVLAAQLKGSVFSPRSDPSKRFREIFRTAGHDYQLKIKGKIGKAIILELDHADYGTLPEWRFLDGCIFKLGYLPGR